MAIPTQLVVQANFTVPVMMCDSSWAHAAHAAPRTMSLKSEFIEDLGNMWLTFRHS